MKIAVVRIRGQVGLNRDVKETLHRLRVRRKYACVVFDNPSKEQMGMIQRMKDFVAYGEIDDKTHKELVDKRGQKDVNVKLKPFFRLHPPRGGIDAKKHFGVKKGVLGNNKKMNELIQRML